MNRLNLFDDLPQQSPREICKTLAIGGVFRLERIVSSGQATPPNEWFDQSTDEWVVLLRGQAELRFEGGALLSMRPGDYVHIPARQRHRVESTSADEPTVWLALHYEGSTKVSEEH